MRSISPGDDGGGGGGGDGLDPDDRAVFEFKSLWASGEPSLERFWAGLGTDRPLTLLSNLVKVDLDARFGRGERPRCAEYLRRFPVLTSSGDRVISIVYEEFCLLEEGGESPDSREFCEAYAPWGDSLRSQLAYHRELSQAAGSPTPSVKFPKPGERFGAYQLRSILGKGGAAQVYLATDDDLGGRRVALKVSASVGSEPSILANLDHQNIVPVLSVTESVETGLRGLCMPYRPGMTLDDLIRRVGRGIPPRKAKAIRDLLVPPDDPGDSRLESDRPGWAGFPAKGTFHEAVAWIGLALANAVSYLHAHGVRHRDIKPANVLLAYREGPQLLDFHLAHCPNAPQHAHAALKGGTLPYMAPEQLQAFVDPSLWDGDQVGTTADIYSLGLVLRELVTGQGPDLPDANLSIGRAIRAFHDRRIGEAVEVRRINPSIPPALESIIAKCLASRPSDRYETGMDLAGDLRNFLDRLPLDSAPNTSSIERGSNFLHRNRKATASGLVLLALYLASASGAGVVVFPADKPGAGAAVPAVYPDLAEFVEAIKDLDSDRPDRWQRAHDTFNRLHKADPRSAWPLLPLGLAWEKLDDKARSNACIFDACACIDADAATSWMIRGRPPSSTRLSARALQFFRNNRYQEARAWYLAALKVEPHHVGALAALGRVATLLKEPTEAVRYFTDAVRFADEARTEAPKVLEYRNALLVALIKLVEWQLAADKSVEERSRAGTTLDAIEAQLGALECLWVKLPEAPGVEDREYTKSVYLGVVLSGRARLAADRLDPGAARAGFEAARLSFERALGAIPAQSRFAPAYRQYVANELAEVQRQSRLVATP